MPSAGQSSRHTQSSSVLSCRPSMSFSSTPIPTSTRASAATSTLTRRLSLASASRGLCRRLFQVGLRSTAPAQRELATRHDVVQVSADDLAGGKRLPTLDGPVYLSIDLDVIDPAFAPGVSHPGAWWLEHSTTAQTPRADRVPGRRGRPRRAESVSRRQRCNGTCRGQDRQRARRWLRRRLNRVKTSCASGRASR